MVTGFEPFGRWEENPSEQLVKHLQVNRDPHVEAFLLPVVFHEAGRKMKELIRHTNPDAVVMLGTAPGRAAWSIERTAVNTESAPIADNSGEQPEDRIIEETGPFAYRTTLPRSRLIQELHAANIPAETSESAGTYVCNSLFYHVMHELNDSYVPAGFIHLPALPSMSLDGKLPTMPLSMQQEALDTVLNTLKKEIESC
ncbi:pyroglutamyl-peptidase I [Alkalicoccus urumqiensis]|uniref:Pyrrolidone-carboxylate peptidase n=2 Tax=Alkalicoccus urumqiensis TaxID=1548213 RepID=A0A2P6MF49_ALKUR|nr:pyroglutamyl-peptidase I [Alkalicoccus urumqiensis]